jgi:hypothetical protein
MKTPRHIVERIRSLFQLGNDAAIERLDRRLFLRGLAVTGAGMIVGVPTIVVPRVVDADFYEFGIWKPDIMSVDGFETGTGLDRQVWAW